MAERLGERERERERERALNPKSLSRIQKTLNRGSRNIPKLYSSHMGFKRERDSNGREVDRQTDRQPWSWRKQRRCQDRW